MRVLVLGGSGGLGRVFVPELTIRGMAVVSPTRKEFDVADPSSSAQLACGDWGQFDWCVNLAAYTAVDKAETERQAAFEINAVGPGYLAAACGAIGAKLCHISTDYVFDGAKGAPYLPDDAVRPLQVYGESKAAGESSVLQEGFDNVVVRVSWLFGPQTGGFLAWLIEKLLAGERATVVTDQVSRPTSTNDLAVALTDFLQSDPSPGVHHIAGPQILDRLTWGELARTTFGEFVPGQVPELSPVTSSELAAPAQRPPYSALDLKDSEKNYQPMRPFDESLREAVAGILKSKGRH